MTKLVWIEEPKLRFGHGQSLEDPRDGLTLFGPLDEGYETSWGVIGTREGIRKFLAWADQVQRPVTGSAPAYARPLFPGVEAAFGIPWRATPVLSLEVDSKMLHEAVRIDDRHQRVFKSVEIFATRVLAARDEDAKVDLWFIVIPDDVYQYCRPRSTVAQSERVESPYRLSRSYARLRRTYAPLLPRDEEESQPYLHSVDFHNQLKARLLPNRILTQIIRESTVAPNEYLTTTGRPKRPLESLASSIAWNITTAAFYKAGGRPWIIAAVREGVCYLGLAFKVSGTDPQERSAACGAQMFLDSGDGIVFRGALGPWYSPKRRQFHLSRAAAKDLVRKAVDAYREKHGTPPRELFIHGRVRFDDDEWAGFAEAVDRGTTIVGVRIQDAKGLKLFHRSAHPVLRGIAYIENEQRAYLWTKGFVPRLQTYPGLEVPKPLLVEVCRGHAPMEQVLRDIMALTKLNYNTCRFADGQPVTLRFADNVGEILTAAPLKDVPPLPFKHYI